MKREPLIVSQGTHFIQDFTGSNSTVRLTSFIGAPFILLLRRDRSESKIPANGAPEPMIE